ncbi:MAG: YVTN family beta-propeller repeat-containing protein, partial [Treponema sp.]|nr:YVTN family beta-propeller repeat-containing protein [Treponema sp.]
MRKNIFFLILTFTLLLAQALFCQEKTPSKVTPQISVEKIGTYPCGRQPKQVLFSPDGKFIVMPLLEDNGFDIFSV